MRREEEKKIAVKIWTNILRKIMYSVHLRGILRIKYAVTKNKFAGGC